jgi:beta-galactosidase
LNDVRYQPTPAGPNYRAMIYINGWLIGRYIADLGPQYRFYVPSGILHDDGANTIAVAVWALGTGGGLKSVSLLAAGDQAGGVPVAAVPAPGFGSSASKA